MTPIFERPQIPSHLNACELFQTLLRPDPVHPEQVWKGGGSGLFGHTFLAAWLLCLPGLINAVAAQDNPWSQKPLQVGTIESASDLQGSIAPQDVLDAMEHLQSPNPNTRKEAVIRLIELREHAHPALGSLTKALQDENPVVQAYAAHALWRIEHRAAEPLSTLIPLLKSEHPQVRLLATYFLGDMGPAAEAAIPSLRRGLADKQTNVRLYSAEAMTRIDLQDPLPVETLAELLRHGDRETRYLAAYTFGTLNPVHSRRAIAALSSAEHDQDPQVRVVATAGLRNLQRGTSEDGAAGKASVSAGTILPVSAESPAPRNDLLSSTDEAQPSTRNSFGIGFPTARPASRPTDLPTDLSTDLPTDQQADSSSDQVVQVVPPSTELPTFPLLDDSFRQIPPPPLPPVPQSAFSGPGYSSPVLNGVGVPAPEQAPLPFDDDFKPIRELTVNIAPRPGDMPENLAAERIARVARTAPELGTTRGWAMTGFAWEATGLCHWPLYFEQPNLERYGHSFGLLQPFVSYGQFMATLPAIPYLAAIHPPCECIYTLGQYRPGSAAPFCCTRIPLRLDAAIIQGMVVTGLIFAIP